MNRRRALGLLLGAVLAAPLAACGIPQDDEPRLIADEPEELTPSTRADDEEGNRSIPVFLIDQGPDEARLVRSDRTTSAPPVPLEGVVALLEGVTTEEAGERFTTAVPPGTRLREGSVAEPGLIRLDLSEDFDTVAGENLLQAFAQLVYTATQDDRSAAVRFEIGGEPVSAPTERRGQRDEVRRSDYDRLRPTSSSD